MGQELEIERKQGNAGRGMSMSNLGLFVNLNLEIWASQYAILQHSCRSDHPRYGSRSCFLSMNCTSLMTQQQMDTSPKRFTDAAPPSVLSRPRRGGRYLIRNILNSANLNPFQLAALDMLRLLYDILPWLIANAPRSQLSFDFTTIQGVKEWEKHLNFFYWATAKAMRDGTRALRKQQPHPLADAIRALPREVLEGISRVWLPCGIPIHHQSKPGRKKKRLTKIDSLVNASISRRHISIANKNDCTSIDHEVTQRQKEIVDKKLRFISKRFEIAKDDFAPNKKSDSKPSDEVIANTKSDITTNQAVADKNSIDNPCNNKIEHKKFYANREHPDQIIKKIEDYSAIELQKDNVDSNEPVASGAQIIRFPEPARGDPDTAYESKDREIKDCNEAQLFEIDDRESCVRAPGSQGFRHDRGQKFRFLAIVAMVCLCFAGSLGIGYILYTPDGIYQEISQVGPQNVDHMPVDEADPASIFSLAYGAYANGELDKARRMVFGVLGMGGIGDKVEADCYYLLGMVYTAAGEPEKALDYLNLAGNGYNNGNELAIYNVHIEKARAFCNLGELSTAQAFLISAREYYEQSNFESKSAYLSHWYAISYQVALGLGHNEQALSLARDRLLLLPVESEFMRGVALSELGFAMCINGEAKEAGNIIDMAETLLAGNEHELMFAKTTRILFRRAMGEPIQELHDEISIFAEENDLPSLEFSMNWALTWPIEDLVFPK